MPKINIRKKVTVTPAPRVFGKPQERPAIEAPKPETAAPIKEQTFIMRFLDIMVYDVLHTLRLAPDRPEKIIETKPDLEKYEEFCALARGGR